jgi:hypothetical protein
MLQQTLAPALPSPLHCTQSNSGFRHSVSSKDIERMIHSGEHNSNNAATTSSTRFHPSCSWPKNAAAHLAFRYRHHFSIQVVIQVHGLPCSLLKTGLRGESAASRVWKMVDHPLNIPNRAAHLSIEVWRADANGTDQLSWSCMDGGTPKTRGGSHSAQDTAAVQTESSEAKARNRTSPDHREKPPVAET